MTILYYALGYLIGCPLLLVLINLASKQLIKRRMAKKPMTRNSVPPPTFLQKISAPLKYALSDKHNIALFGKTTGIKSFMVFYFLYALGLVCFILAPILKGYLFYCLLAGVCFFGFAISFGVHNSNKILARQEKVYERMFEIAKGKMGYNQEFAIRPQDRIKVLEWEDDTVPIMVTFGIPTTFPSEAEDAFMNLFNQVFGHSRTYVAYNKPNEDGSGFTPGWNYQEAVLTIKAVPPLPTLAKWDEHYITDPGIHWSFFPLGLGVENGIELTNPETGEIENVIGFDLSGKSGAWARDKGYKVGPEIQQTPMILISGGTGGGKAEAVDTKIRVYSKK